VSVTLVKRPATVLIMYSIYITMRHVYTPQDDEAVSAEGVQRTQVVQDTGTE